MQCLPFASAGSKKKRILVINVDERVHVQHFVSYNAFAKPLQKITTELNIQPRMPLNTLLFRIPFTLFALLCLSPPYSSRNSDTGKLITRFVLAVKDHRETTSHASIRRKTK